LDFIPLFGQIFRQKRQRDIEPVGGLLPDLLTEVGVPVIFHSIELNFSGCFRQDREPAPCPLVLRPDPELAEDTRRKGECPDGIDFIREFFFNDAVATDCIPDFFQPHCNNRRPCGTSTHRMVMSSRCLPASGIPSVLHRSMLHPVWLLTVFP